MLTVGLRKFKGFRRKTRIEARWGWHWLARTKKRRAEKLEIVYLWWQSAYASTASERPQKSRWQNICTEDKLFSNKARGKLRLTVARYSIPSKGFPQSKLTPILFSSWYAFAIIMQPVVIRPITSNNLGGFRIST